MVVVNSKVIQNVNKAFVPLRPDRTSFEIMLLIIIRFSLGAIFSAVFQTLLCCKQSYNILNFILNFLRGEKVTIFAAISAQKW